MTATEQPPKFFSFKGMTAFGRLVEVAEDCFAVRPFVGDDFPDWPLWRSAIVKFGSVAAELRQLPDSLTSIHAGTTR